MSALVVNDSQDFKSLKELLGVTDGNLATHLKSLEKNEYINFKKKFLNRKPQFKYFATATGRKVFKTHVGAIEQLLKII